MLIEAPQSIWKVLSAGQLDTPQCWRLWFASENLPLNISKSSQENDKIFSQKYIGSYAEEKGVEGEQSKEGADSSVFLASERPPRNKRKDTHRHLLASGEPTSATHK